jgi:hypothetical protein
LEAGQRSNAFGHLGWNLHPDGGKMRLGTDPAMEGRTLIAASTRGTDARRPWVRHLHDVSGIHHGDPVADGGDDSQVVGD